jgi:hypothetical protein
MFGLKKAEMMKQIELDRRIQLTDKDGSHIYMTLCTTENNEYYLQLHESGIELLNSTGQLKTFKSIESAIQAANAVGANQVRINLI